MNEHDNHSTIPWWKSAAIYHVYPRSFLDGNGDGIGDLPGIASKLDYLEETGFQAILIGPVFESPQVDCGYDISDHKSIDPCFGTMGDMEHLIQQAEKRGIRIILDLVLNHTSNRHSWFEQSRRDPAGEYGDYYIWRDGVSGAPPNSWHSIFGGEAWAYDEERGQYYLHLFAREQPDLNWDNPKVRAEVAEIANFWIRKGVRGFRLDAINLISKAPGFPEMKNMDPRGIYIDGPNLIPYLKEFRSTIAKTAPNEEIFLFGENALTTPEMVSEVCRSDGSILNMVLTFDHVSLDHTDGNKWKHRQWMQTEMADAMERWQHADGGKYWPSLFLSNHDQPRVVGRYGSDTTHREASAKVLSLLFYLQRGTPFIYQGEEIAMTNFPIRGVQDLHDVESNNYYREMVEEKGVDREEVLADLRRIARDNARSPMQWDAMDYAGFIDPGLHTSEIRRSTPWYPVNPDYQDWNVWEQLHRPDSNLRFLQRLLELRTTPPLLAGRFLLLHRGDPIAYARLSEHAEEVGAGKTQLDIDYAVVVANPSETEVRWRPDIDSFPWLEGSWRILLDTTKALPTSTKDDLGTLDLESNSVLSLPRYRGILLIRES